MVLVADDSNTTSIEIDEFNEADDGNGTVTSIEYAPGTVIVAQEEDEDVMTVGLVTDDEDEVIEAGVVDDMAVLPIVEEEEVMMENVDMEGPLIFPEAPDNEAAMDMEMMEDMVMGKNSLDAFANDRRHLRAAPQHNP